MAFQHTRKKWIRKYKSTFLKVQCNKKKIFNTACLFYVPETCEA